MQTSCVRIGVIVPSVNRVIEPEFYAMRPPGIAFHFARARYVFGPDPAPLEGLAEDTVRQVQSLADARVSVITSGSTGGSFFGGPNFDAQLIRRMEAQAPIACTTPSTAVAAALRVLEARTLCVITPYTETDNRREAAFLQAHGFRVKSIVGMGIANGGDIADVPLEQVNGFVLRHLDPEVDVCFVSCTNLHTAPLISGWESTVGKPVLTSNTATLWMVSRMARVSTTVAEYGSLLAKMPELPS